MLPKLNNYRDQITLVRNSGIQFLDLGFAIDGKEPAGQFAKIGTDQFTLLAKDSDGTFYSINTETTPENRIEASREYSLSIDESLEILDGHWLPLPFLRFNKERYENGPENWARIRYTKLDQPDAQGNTHRITLAFDTSLIPYNSNIKYLAPTPEDVATPSIFKLGFFHDQASWFFAQEWINEWLEEIYIEHFPDLNKDRLKEQTQAKRHITHYLNVLSLIGPIATHKNTHQPKTLVPAVKLIEHNGEVNPAIPVDLILDVGNSRTCGILVENHGQANEGLSHNYLLQLRDLSHPENVYSEAFESRIEFQQASFGRNNFSLKSGRNQCFTWPTFARTGHEAQHLASHSHGVDGDTGISSPKRYLWDVDSYEPKWVFNSSDNDQYAQKARATPFASHINGEGEALYTIKDIFDRVPVLAAAYSRSSLMTFMLAEVISQALVQINSYDQRLVYGKTEHPRHLSSITLTVPPGMPLAERAILNNRLLQAIALVWKCMGWHNGDESPYAKNPEHKPLISLPSLHVEWDEASCGQLVYLYSEITNNFSQHPEEFFDSIALPEKQNRKSITLATIDIGGGTTDVVITKYSLNGQGINTHIIPDQLFRDSFKIAGDDILLDVIQKYVLPSFEEAIRQTGVRSTETVMSYLCGYENPSTRERLLRQQLNLQLFTPIGLQILQKYEAYEPTEHDTLSGSYRYGSLLDYPLSESIKDYINDAIQEAGGNAIENFENIEIALNLKQIHHYFLNLKNGLNITQALRSISEVIFQYECDQLLLAGRPSCLPGIQALVRQLMPVTPDRVLSMYNYQSGSWYPFHKNQRISDPKTTASVGALLCLLSYENRLQNFYFRAVELKPYSTIKQVGIVDGANTITDQDVLFRDIQTQEVRGSQCIVLPKDPATGEPPLFHYRGAPTLLGYRQLASQRWSASPLYLLQMTPEASKKYGQFTSRDVKDTSHSADPLILISFEVADLHNPNDDPFLINDTLSVARVRDNLGGEFSERDITLKLNTMPSSLSTKGVNSYWLDSGSIKSV